MSTDETHLTKLRGDGPGQVMVLSGSGKCVNCERLQTIINENNRTIADLTSRLTNHETLIVNHQTQITDQQTQLTNQQTQITNQQAQITNQQAQIDRLTTMYKDSEPAPISQKRLLIGQMVYEFIKLVESNLNLDADELEGPSFAEIKQVALNMGNKGQAVFEILNRVNEDDMDVVIQNLRKLRRSEAHPDFYATTFDDIKTIVEQQYSKKTQQKTRKDVLSLVDIISALIDLE